MTRNTNSYRFKGRAVFLAAIMVISMLAMPVAFTGVAAADLGDGDGDIQEDLDVGNVEDAAGASAAQQVVTFTVDDLEGTDDGTATIDYENVSDADGEVIGASGFTNDTENTSIDVDFDEDEVTVDIDGTDDSADTVLVTLNVVHDLSDVDPVLDVDTPILNDTNVQVDSNEFNVEGRDVEDRNRAYEGQIVQIENSSYSDEDVELIRDPGDDNDNEFIDVESADGDGLVFFDTEGLTTGDDYAFVNESSGDTIAEFQLTSNRFDAEWSDNEVEDAGDTTVDLELDANRGTYTVHVTADNLDGDEVYELFEDLDGEDVYETNDGALLDGVSDGDFEANFEGVDLGDYEFEFDMVDTVASEEDSITVVDGEDDDLVLVDDSPEATQGDIAEIEIEDVGGEGEGFLVIGGFDDIGYEAVVEINDVDEDTFTIEFNTYLAGTEEDDIVTSEDANIELVNEGSDQQTDIDGILDTGDYDLSLGTDDIADPNDADQVEDFIDDADEVGALFIEERVTGDMTLWTASSDNAEDIEDADDIESAVDDETLTQADTIAFGDALVHQIEIDGLGGFFAATGEDDLDDALIEAIDADVANIDMEQTDDTRQSNRRAKTLTSSNLTADELEVVYDGGELYVIMPEFPEDEDFWNNDRTPVDDDRFNVDLNVSDERILEEGDERVLTHWDDDDEEFLFIGSEFGVADRDGEFINLNDDDEIEVEAGEDQAITAETNIAPGTELRIRASGTDGARFVKSQSDLVVTADGEVEGNFDFSDRSEGDTFEASLRGTNFADDRPEADGIIVDAVEEPVDDDEEPVDDDEEPVDDDEEPVDDEEEPVDDEEEPVDDTDDETPGFGALVALVALLGAALLAARRQN